MDKHDLKNKLTEYLEGTGHELNTKKRPPVVRCPNPSHDDGSPSAIVYPDRVWCPVCGENWDIFDVAGLVENTSDFKLQKEAIEKNLGVTMGKLNQSKKTQPKKKAKPRINKDYVVLPVDEGREVYSPDNVTGLMRWMEKKNDWPPAEYIKMWPYMDIDGNVCCVDVRFESEKKKQVITFWYNGKTLKLTNAPHLLYGLQNLKKFPDKPVLIVEGCKTATSAEAMEQFNVVTWRGGSNKIDKHDWTILKNSKIFILPDDDVPGLKAANEIKKLLPQSTIVPPFAPAREIRKTGADCVEYLQLLSAEELAKYIFDSKNKPEKKEKNKPEEDDIPFRIMGRSGENDTFFIDRDGWLIGAQHGAYNKQFCLRLAPLNWWKFESGFSNEKTRSIYWDDVLCWLIGESNRDFDPNTIRGRGAWKNKQGDMCFNDGKVIWGAVDKNCHYLRKQALDVGLDSKAATPAQRGAIDKANERLRYETRMDGVRTLAWATLAPFCGALPWRSAALLTGSSGSGKTSIIDLVIKPISVSLTVSGGESTEAGVRQAIGSDSRSVIIEEAEKDTQKKAGRREDLFSLMRQSTSDDAPVVAKGTQDGKGMSFQLRSMFLFAAISPEVAQIADDNRIFKLNLKSASKSDAGEWPDIKKQLVKSITPETSAGVRSFVWKNLRRILNLSEKISDYVQEITQRGTRYSLAEALFLSCYFVVYRDHRDDDIDAIKDEIKSLINLAPKEETRDDALEMLERILDENIFISSERGTRTIGEIARILGEGKMPINDDSYESPLPKDMQDYRLAIGRHGVTVSSTGDLCIANNHHRISEITGSSRGYNLTLKRLEVATEDKVCKFAGESKRATVILGYYNPSNKEKFVY